MAESKSSTNELEMSWSMSESSLVPMELKKSAPASFQALKHGNDLVIEQTECGGGSSVDWFPSVGTFRDGGTTQNRGHVQNPPPASQVPTRSRK